MYSVSFICQMWFCLFHCITITCTTAPMVACETQSREYIQVSRAGRSQKGQKARSARPKPSSDGQDSLDSDQAGPSNYNQPAPRQVVLGATKQPRVRRRAAAVPRKRKAAPRRERPPARKQPRRKAATSARDGGLAQPQQSIYVQCTSESDSVSE